MLKPGSFVVLILHAIPVQMLACCVAVARDAEVGQPRKLAKPVTAERARGGVATPR